MKTQLLKIIRSKLATTPKTSRNAVNPLCGGYNHWLWFSTGVRRNHSWTPRLVLGVEYSALPETMPVDGGTFPTGKWSTTVPTGRKRLMWD